MALIEEYRRSLKTPEAEEALDLVLYRPIAFLFVKTIYRLPITPNQVTVLSMLAGLLAGWEFSIASSSAYAWGAFWYFVANVLDCSDGQLARLQQSGTLLGRLVDGIADYVCGVAVLIGIGLRLSVNGAGIWWFVVAAAVSSAIHAASFDYYQNEFTSTARKKESFGDREIKKFREVIRRMREERRDVVKVFFLNIYLWYLDLQKKSGGRTSVRLFDPEMYRNRNAAMIRFWSLLGPTTNRTLLIICALLGRVDWYLWIVVLPWNAWFLVCQMMQRRIHRRLEVR